MHDIIDELNKLYDFKTNVLTDINDLGLYIENNNGFITFHINIRSITKHFDQLLVIMLNNNSYLLVIITAYC